MIFIAAPDLSPARLSIQKSPASSGALKGLVLERFLARGGAVEIILAPLGAACRRSAPLRPAAAAAAIAAPLSISLRLLNRTALGAKSRLIGAVRRGGLLFAFSCKFRLLRLRLRLLRTGMIAVHAALRILALLTVPAIVVAIIIVRLMLLALLLRLKVLLAALFILVEILFLILLRPVAQIVLGTGLAVIHDLRGHQKTVIVLCMLIIIFRRHPVARRKRIPGELLVLFANMRGSTTNFDVGTRAVIGAVRGILGFASASAGTLVIVPLPHVIIHVHNMSASLKLNLIRKAR